MTEEQLRNELEGLTAGDEPIDWSDFEDSANAPLNLPVNPEFDQTLDFRLL